MSGVGGAQALVVLVVVLVGLMVPAQAGINAELRRHVGHPLIVAIMNFSSGLVLLIIACLALRVTVPSVGKLTAAPWWAFLGGTFGAALVLAGVLAAPRLGAALLVASLVAGQLVASVLLDHYGLLGYAVKPITLGRFAGVMLLGAGVYMLQRG